MASHEDTHLTPDIAARLDHLDRLANNLDSRYRVPLTNIRFGWDAILGLVPGIGDVAALAPAGYILLEAHRMGAPTPVKVRMAANTGVDWLIGSIPLVGDLLDVGLRANRRNVALLRGEMERRNSPGPESRPIGDVARTSERIEREQTA